MACIWLCAVVVAFLVAIRSFISTGDIILSLTHVSILYFSVDACQPELEDASDDVISGDGQYDSVRNEYCLHARQSYEPGEQVSHLPLL